ncbi:hypothetical protein KC324_g233 [Hortaea werneckii]|nr:hypothetical protein KC324_g233 [Hortaea werneckii]
MASAIEDCQSNCVLHPKPSGPGSNLKVLQNKVIGYYESWSSRKTCHAVDPADLPLDALTHLNYAFAFIDPGTYQIVTMDSSTPSGSFKDATNVKSIKPDLKVSFSDDGSKTQPLFGEIAADASKRQIFANYVVHFMNQYGFDGLDVDWEYPGAPDRGGKPRNTKNFKLLMKTLRNTFDASGKDFGLTFTAPSSHWYLRWFDLPELIRYVDWINLMSYDLHGVWDSTNPIGSIVQGHTNLTEIKLAAELFWRVNVPPAMLSIKPVYDEQAAVKHVVFDQDQWISYDDSETFDQKVQWANSIGLGGAMIWASDLDDEKYTAHSELTGRSVISNAQLQAVDKAISSPQSVIQDVAGDNGQNCFAYDGKCVNLNDKNAMANACGSGFTAVGWDDAGCGTKKCHCGKPICCPSNQAPKMCTWRGDKTGGGASSDCSGQCKVGEVNIKGITSSWGGGFNRDGNTNKCARGYKAFCCARGDYGTLTQGCSYTKCRTSCKIGTEQLFEDISDCFIGSKKYCCPKPSDLTDCHWVTHTGGGVAGDCANAKCSPKEVEVARNKWGNGAAICSWGRKQAACCSISKAPPPQSMCSADLCAIVPDLCPAGGGAISKRNPSHLNAHKRHAHHHSPYQDPHSLERRGEQSVYQANLGGGLTLYVITALYPVIRELYQCPNQNQTMRNRFVLLPGPCINPAIDEQPVAQGPTPPGLNGMDTEHPLDRQIAARFLEAAATGLLRGSMRPDPPQAAVNRENLHNEWTQIHPPLGQHPPVGGPKGVAPVQANDRMMEAFGSTDWPEPLMPTDSGLNGAKGNLMNLQAPIGLTRIRTLARDAAGSGTSQDINHLLSAVRTGFALMEYMNNPDFARRLNLVRNQVRTQLGYIENAFAQHGTPVTGLQAWWDIFLPDYFLQIEQWAQNWTEDAILDAFRVLDRPQLRNNNQQVVAAIATLRAWLDRVDVDIVFDRGFYGWLP